MHRRSKSKQRKLKIYMQLCLTHCRNQLRYAKETGASTWLTALSIAKHGFTLHKGAFFEAQGFWGSDRQCAFFFMFGFLIPSHRPTTPSPCPLVSEDTNKKRKGHMISKSGKSNMVVSHPLSFQYLHGGMGPTAKVIYKKLASMIVTKHNQPYSQTVDWLRWLSFPCFASPSCAQGGHVP